jgi:hypothetical protein
MTTRKLVLLAFLCLALSALCLAQGGVATGDLHVVVKDPKGSLVPNATVTVRNVAKGVERDGAGDGQGGYSVHLLPPGSYTVTVEAPGFAKAQAPDVAVTVGGLAELPVALTVAAGKEVVEVSSQSELVETSSSTTTNTIGERRIDNLPINGRNYIQFTLTDSQVTRDNAPDIGAAPTSGLNISGQRARSNLVNVDGADAIDNSTNGVRSTVSQEAVQEFQIINNSYAAEFGRASGGVVNIITRSGSNAFHGDVYGYLRNRSFQAVNPFSTVSNPAYTRVQAGTAFGGPIKKDKTYYYFSYEVTRRHETGFSSIGQGNFGLVPFDTATIAGGAVPLPFGTIQATQEQATFLQTLNPAQVNALGGVPGLINYVALIGGSSGMAVNGAWPTGLVQGLTGGLLSKFAGFPTSCAPPGPCFIPSTFQTVAAQIGNFPVFEGTSLYSLRLDHNISDRNRLMLRGNVSPSTVTGIEVAGENQPFGQNAYNRTSLQTYRDLAIVAQDSWTVGTNKVNEFRFQYARRGLLYDYSSAAGGSDPAINIFGFAFFGREPYSYIQRTEQRYQFTDNFSWTIRRHATKFGVDFNYIPVTATFTVNYGGVYDFGSITPVPGAPSLNPVQAYGAGIPQDFIQGIGNPHDSFTNKPLGVFWQDSWRVNPNLTLNYGVRYDVEFPPKFSPPTGLALSAYNQLGIQKGIQTDTNNVQPRIGVAWDPRGDGKSVIRASYGMFYDHPLLGLYFLGDASDGSKSGQLLFFGANPGCNPAAPALSLTATNIFQGLAGACFPQAVSAFGYEANQQQFNAFYPNSLFLNQGYVGNGVPLVSQPFGYPQSKNFVYAYAQQANFTFEQDLGHGFALSLGYNFNGGRHLNRPINANAARGDLLTANWQAAVAASPAAAPSSPLAVASCGVNPIPGSPLPFYVPAALVNFFRPSGLNPSLAGGALAPCIPLALADLKANGLNAACDPLVSGLAGCVPFSDMDANYSNGSSIYHGLTASLRKRFNRHYEFLASYTYSHAIDDSTDLQSPLAPQDSFYPYYNNERSNSLFDQRHRFVFSAVYQSGRLSGDGFMPRFLSNWTVAPIVDIGSGRPFNIITGTSDNFQFDPTGARPNVVAAGTPTNACGYPTVASKFSPSGYLQEVCFADITPAQLAAPNALTLFDGSLGRNVGLQPFTVFDDLRVARRINLTERFNVDLIADMFNLANKNNVSAVSLLLTNAGQPTAAYDPRQFQFAMKLNW